MSHEDRQARDHEKIPANTTQDVEFVEEEKEKWFVGAYEIVRQMGEGGMGTVYLGVRADREFKKHVAIKVIKKGMDSEAIIARFRRERQILASLDHPNIARLLDGGTTKEGLPYFVMEYIAGKPLTSYCDSHRLTIRERLALFRRICEAVQYAHQNLIVHRDLKPGNILVTADGEIKLLDFGIAKLLNPDVFSGDLPLTATDMRAMTPEYASPEQARGDSITTVSDVYSLGVILYELLSGRLPYRFTSKNPMEMMRIITEEEPAKPSTAITKSKDADTDRLSTLRGGSAEKLQKQLRGDLDNIILMALRKEPQRRYASVEAFLEDIRRYMEGHPVAARKNTWSYRTGKYVRRHTAGVTAAAAVFLLLVTFSGIVAFQNIKISRQSAEISQQRDAAVKSEQKAQRVTEFLSNLFEVNDPAQSKGENLTARQILDRGAEKLQKEFKDQPDVQAELLNRVGMIYEKLGMYDQAETLVRQSFSIRQSVYKSDHTKIATSLHDIGQVLWRKGHYAEAEKLFIRALAMDRKLFGNEHLDVARDLYDLANVYMDNGQLDEAEKLYREALAVKRKIFANNANPDLAVNLEGLGHLLYLKKELEEAEKLVREALAMDRRLHGNDHPDVAITLNSLANVLHDKGDLEEAEKLFREALAILRRLYGNEHPEVATVLKTLASVLYDKGQLEEAEKLYREALAMRRKLLGNEHPDVARAMNDLAILLEDKGQLDESENLLRQALSIRNKVFGNEHADVASTLGNLGYVLEEKGQLDEAENVFRQALAIDRKLFGKEDVEVAKSLMEVAKVLLAKGKASDAIATADEVLAFSEDTLPADNRFRARVKSVKGAALVSQRKYAEAELLLLDAYKVQSLQEKGGRNPQLTLRRIVDLYHAWGKSEKAAQYRKLAVQTQQKSPSTK